MRPKKLSAFRAATGLLMIMTNLGATATFADSSSRIHSYSGFSTSVLGDIRTVGMSGNELGDTYLSAANNPSGLAMTLSTIDTSLVQDSIQDSNIQNYNNIIKLSSIGAAVNLYPWGFSLGNIPTTIEGSANSQQIQAHEIRLGVARLFMNHRLSIGLSLNYGIAEEQDASSNPVADQKAAAIGATLGATFQLPERLLLGLGVTTPMHYSFNSIPDLGNPSFFQPMDTPFRSDLSLGWIPNRFVRADIRVSLFGTTSGAALLGDDSALVGNRMTLQPAAGFAYEFMDYPILVGTLYGGSYFEFSRIQNAPDRLHVTGGLEAKAWMLTSGFGIDSASGYFNFLFGIGIDVGLVLQYLRIIPQPYHAPYRHLLPSPFLNSDDGLPRPLVAHWDSHERDLDLVKIATDVPKNIKKEMKRIKEGKGALKLPKEPRPPEPNSEP